MDLGLLWTLGLRAASQKRKQSLQTLPCGPCPLVGATCSPVVFSDFQVTIHGFADAKVRDEEMERIGSRAIWHRCQAQPKTQTDLGLDSGSFISQPLIEDNLLTSVSLSFTMVLIPKVDMKR